MSLTPFGFARNGMAGMSGLKLANPPLFIAILVAIILFLTKIVEMIEDEEGATISTAIAKSILDNCEKVCPLSNNITSNHTTPDSNEPKKQIKTEHNRQQALHCDLLFSLWQT